MVENDNVLKVLAGEEKVDLKVEGEIVFSLMRPVRSNS